MPTAARLTAAVLACGLLALSCDRQPWPGGAVEVANPRSDPSARGGVSGNVGVASPLPAEAAASPTLDSPIQKIDFANFSYPFPDRTNARKRIKLRDGEQPPTRFGEHGMPHDIGYGLGEVSHGDLTGDGIEEGIVVLNHIHSGSGISAYVYIYTPRSNRPALLWSFTTGDRADGGLQKVAAENGESIVELMGRNKIIGTDLYAGDGTSKGDCCPDAFTRTRYRWREGRFRQQGRPEVIFLDAPSPAP